MAFFKNFFLASGIIWTLCALAILIFKLTFQPKEIILVMVLPLSWALFGLFTKPKYSKTEQVDKRTLNV